MGLKTQCGEIRIFFSTWFIREINVPPNSICEFEFSDFLPFFRAEILQIQHSEPKKKYVAFFATLNSQ